MKIFSIFKKVQTNTIYNLYTGRHYEGKIIDCKESNYWDNDNDYTIETETGKKVILNSHWLEPSTIIGRLFYKPFDKNKDVFLKRWYEMKIRKEY